MLEEKTIKQILISNDDGVNAEGIKVIAKVMQAYGHVTVVAPDRERSGHSHSITTKLPLRASKLSEESNLSVYSLDGTPVDCIKWALERLYSDSYPDIVISGINKGANVGQDIFYSGTIGAAREASLYGIPAISISAGRDKNEKVDFAWIEASIEALMPKLLNIDIPQNHILNVNIPSVLPSEVKGVKVVEMDIAHKRFDFKDYADTKGHPVYWMNSLYQTSTGSTQSDHFYVKEGYVTVSPINVSASAREMLSQLNEIFNTMEE